MTDESTGEALIGAAIRMKELSGSLTLSNDNGFFSIHVPEGSYQIIVSYIGYSSHAENIELLKDTSLHIQLKPGQSLDEVTVTAAIGNKQFDSPQMGQEFLKMSEVKDIPVLFGESDILKTLQLLPGIKSAGEGNSGFYVRGGGADQNLILLDEAPVYNASHLFGFFSAFNSDAVKDVTVYKGGMPAQYGGRLASVVDVKMTEGNKKQFAATGGLGLIASRLKLEGPFAKEKASFMVSGRRTYADLFLRLSPDSAVSSSALHFYDINFKADYRLNSKNAIYFSGYTGNDVLGLQKIFSMDWGNTTASLRWNRLFNSKLSSNTALVYSNYDYTVQSLEKRNDFKISSGIQNMNLKYDFQYYAGNRNILRFGINAEHYTISPGKIQTSEKSSMNNKKLEERQGAEFAFFVADEINLANGFNLVGGLRLSSFSLLGPGTFHTYDIEGGISSTKSVSSGQVVKRYWQVEPRISASYLLDEYNSIKASYTRNSQNLHLLSNSTSTLPTDLWAMSSANIKPQVADQFSLGYYSGFNKDQFELSAEIYYKDMQHQIDYRNAAQLQANENVESELLYGTGRAYGLELFLKKRYGDLSGWIGYTLSRSERRFDELNGGRYFPAKQDRTHDLSLVGIYKINKRITLSMDFVYSTGNAVTFPSGKYTVSGQTAYYYTERNGYRMPDYHRLDVSVVFAGIKRRNYQSSWTVGVYNLYNRKNAYTIDFENDADRPDKTNAVKTSLFGIIPSVSWSFKF